ncbi:lysozyme inhibitor LprI family protein [Chitinophaga sp. 22620]|uniref:lysozyme inhibitor LprI family protein n=1 Tax=Chitinophaga sp. 22620 TaxID=3453952 RepID=UPI003F82D77C
MLYIRTLSMATLLLISIQVCSAQSQYDLNASADKDLQKAEKELNTVYQKILVQYKADTAFIRNLKAAQRIWLQLRNADVDAQFPPNPLQGSVTPMCRSNAWTGITLDRTKYLKQWLEGTEEGDVCAGSIKYKD